MNTTPAFTTGRKKIFCYEDSITKDNVKGVVKAALLVHNENIKEIDWLFQLYRGKDQLIENRVRDGVNQNINYRANVSYYSLIADYASNLFMQNPIVLVNVDGYEEISDGIKELNKYHRVINKYARDKTTSIHAAVSGVAYRFIEQDKRYGIKDSVLSPKSVMVLYGDDTDDTAMAKVYITQVRDDVAGEEITKQSGVGNLKFKNRYTVYTDDFVYTWIDDDKDENVKVTKAMPWGCPIVEYKLNPFYIGSFERVTILIHLLSILRSDGVNGVVQSIAGLILGKNVGLPMDKEDDSEEERLEKEKIREEFRTQLKIYRQIWVDDSKEYPVSIDYIATELFNADIEVLYSSIKNDIIYITRTPNSVMNLGASGNAGAAETASGMTQALENAKNAEPFWFESVREQTRIELDILHYQNKLENLSIFDFDFAMPRSVAVDKITSSQSYATLVGAGVKPSDAARFAEITPDPESWEKRVLEYEEFVYDRENERRIDNGRSEKNTSKNTIEDTSEENTTKTSGKEIEIRSV